MAYQALDCITSSDIEALGLPSEVAERFYQNLNEIIRNYSSATPETWQRVSKHLLEPDLPFSLHQMMYYGCYKGFGPDPPAWIPDPLVAVLSLARRRDPEEVVSNNVFVSLRFQSFKTELEDVETDLELLCSLEMG
ncbi:hypothetical protein TEA_015522 [Camellia sinensis var. sinensis]|uniref:Uncharacterized protein n=1 Tax=Camellia sinensis var. sinensis TaxID=542762 RepID=A0A4S4DYV1_CAMSN|nr:hypothetical protein TEA_015522 [Camellia sinensis var. sinensis]